MIEKERKGEREWDRNREGRLGAIKRWKELEIKTREMKRRMSNE